MTEDGSGSEPVATLVKDEGKTHAKRDTSAYGCAEGTALGEYRAGDLVQSEKEDDVACNGRCEKGIIYVE